ncbi:hypothetical protein BN1088_540002 [Sphingobacterium sp. PM2-P1-29]|nr:hypothetical protein BN1088_540002 [Sphingobacterium sp. PM2-P1-29]
MFFLTTSRDNQGVVVTGLIKFYDHKKTWQSSSIYRLVYD